MPLARTPPTFLLLPATRRAEGLVQEDQRRVGVAAVGAVAELVPGAEGCAKVGPGGRRARQTTLSGDRG